MGDETGVKYKKSYFKKTIAWNCKVTCHQKVHWSKTQLQTMIRRTDGGFASAKRNYTHTQKRNSGTKRLLLDSDFSKPMVGLLPSYASWRCSSAAAPVTFGVSSPLFHDSRLPTAIGETSFSIEHNNIHCVTVPHITVVPSFSRQTRDKTNGKNLNSCIN